MRPRARPSFTVEIKRNRVSGQNPDPRAADPWWGSDLRSQLALDPEPILVAEAPERDVEASPPPSGPRGRILPNLLNREDVAEAPPANRAEDAPAPRRGRKPGMARPAPSAPPSLEAEWAYGPVVEVRRVLPALQAQPPVAGTSPPRMQARAGRGADEAALKPGERWKRRLPRVLW